jgi:hypothetical protein
MGRDARESYPTRPVLAAIDRFIEICVARSETFDAAEHEASAPALKEQLHELGVESRHHAVALQGIVKPFGRGSASGTRVRHRHDPRARSDREVLSGCIDAELASLADFELAFTWAPLSVMPMVARALTLSAYSATMRALSELRRSLLAI